MIELFSVHTIVEEFSGHSNVKLSWFRLENRKVPAVSYAEVIRDYNSDDFFAPYAESALDELFTCDEAEALKAYLEEHHDDSATFIKKCDLPLDKDVGGFRAIPTGGGPDNYPLWRERWYTLPFKVEGFFDLRNYERIDGRENIARFSSQLILTPGRGVIRVGQTMERLLAEHPTWTAEQALAEVERLARER